MYPNYESFAPVVYAEYFAFALLVSGISGVLVSLILKLRVRRAAIAKDAFVGATVSLITIYTLGHLDFEYTFITAVVVAVLVPTLQEFYRSKHPGSGDERPRNPQAL